MKVLLIAAISVDGYIAHSSDELVDWTSKEDKRLFSELTRKANVIVMGGTTYRTLGQPLPGRRNIIYSRQRHLKTLGVELTQELPLDLIRHLEQEGVQTIVVCGGYSVYSMFLKAGVVDELYLTVEPVLFGRGVHLTDLLSDVALELISYAPLNTNTVLLHYGVLK